MSLTPAQTAQARQIAAQSIRDARRLREAAEDRAGHRILFGSYLDAELTSVARFTLHLLLADRATIRAGGVLPPPVVYATAWRLLGTVQDRHRDAVLDARRRAGRAAW